MKGPVRAAVFCLIGGQAPGVLALESELLTLDADVTAVWDDNQSQAQYERDQVEDRALVAGARLAASWDPTFHSMLQGALFGEFEDLDEVDVLDRATLGVKGSWRWQPSSAFTAPVVEFNLSVQTDDHDADARDSDVVQSQLFATRRLTDRITSTAGFRYRRRDSDGSVWDLEDARVFLNLDYAPGNSLAFYLTYSRIEGDTFSSARRSYCNGSAATRILPLINAATAIEADAAYNDTFCGDWVAYRIDAQTDAFVFGANWGLSHDMALDLSVLDVHVEESDNHDIYYDRTLIRASLLKRF